jgi:hypothetical protein
VCLQSICYVLCFHGVDLATRHSSTSAHTAQWVSILLSPTMPLRFCLHSVRAEFLRLAEGVGLLPEELLRVLVDFTNGPGYAYGLGLGHMNYRQQPQQQTHLQMRTYPPSSSSALRAHKSEFDLHANTSANSITNRPQLIRAGFDISYLL